VEGNWEVDCKTRPSVLNLFRADEVSLNRTNDSHPNASKKTKTIRLNSPIPLAESHEGQSPAVLPNNVFSIRPGNEEKQ
jgi:hypothetical protein